MATKSVLKTVYIKDKNAARRLASALENAKGKHVEQVVMSRAVSDASREEVRSLFAKKDARV